LLDQNVIQSGFVDVPAHGKANVILPWPWEFQRHDLTFEIDSDHKFHEVEEANNTLTVQTDAISVGFYVERSLYEYFQANQNQLKAGSNSWEDWAQRQIAKLNSMFASAISPEAPKGVLDRWRIDDIQVVPDNSLPLQGGGGRGIAARDPNAKDLTVDIIWGFPSSWLDTSQYALHTWKSEQNPFYIEGGMLHELGHVRYLYDVYLFRVEHDGRARIVDIREAGHPVVGSSLMPLSSSGVVYKTFEVGLMNETYKFLDRYSAVSLNLIAGFRARGEYGNTISNYYLGSFLSDIPLVNRIRFVDRDGRPLTGARVELYKPERGPLIPGGPTGQMLVIRYGENPDLVATTDANGEIELKGDPFRKMGNP
jgi:hypothetical protein